MTPRKPSDRTVEVEATVYPDDRRVNLPTQDAAIYFDGSEQSTPELLYPRQTELDPQLVWRGKDQQDREPLSVDAPPIYIQEKIDPRVLIENLRDAPDSEQPPLWDAFDGLDELDRVEFYRHEANWTNRLVLGDSLQAMSSLVTREGLRGQVQMIYIDPPYGIKFGSNWQVSARSRSVKDGKDTAVEVEQIKAFRDTWEDGLNSYLSYLRDRLIVARDLLTDSGSVFVQIGDENVHLVRALLDEVFGRENFVGQIAFKTTTGATSEFLAGVYDYLLWFGKDRKQTRFRPLYQRRDVTEDSNYRWVRDPDGTTRTATEADLDAARRGQAPRFFRQNPLTSQSGSATTIFPVEFEGRTYAPSKGGWKTNADGMARLRRAGRLMGSGRTLGFVRFFEDFPFQVYSNAWDDTRQSGFGAEKLYVVQTATKVIERCILMCTSPGDLVLDPTCGSGTTAYVAERWGRRWITMDTSRVALALTRQRIMAARYPSYLKADSPEGAKKEAELNGVPVSATTTRGDIRRGFVCERVRHVTLKSIANNPDLVEGMSPAEIDAAIARHAEFEILHDRPYVDSGRVRVSGPFTVESLSPHRSIEFSADTNRESVSDYIGAADAEGPSFEQSILESLGRAGIQNGRRPERIEFAALDPHAGRYVQAIGLRRSELEDAGRVAIAIGPQYGTVSADFIKRAAREALADPEVGLLCVLGFSFDPQATSVLDTAVELETREEFAHVADERRLGRLKILLVRMNSDLLMATELKNTAAGNLFTVFGEPDIRIRREGDSFLVDLNGVDVYDPTTGEIRSRQPDRIALWMIDTNYDDESFFVRHCYFTGGNDPYKSLRAALKSEIDREAWEALYRTTSTPFARPSSGKIAVKVINDWGDEVMKVFPID